MFDNIMRDFEESMLRTYSETLVLCAFVSMLQDISFPLDQEHEKFLNTVIDVLDQRIRKHNPSLMWRLNDLKWRFNNLDFYNAEYVYDDFCNIVHRTQTTHR